MADDYGDLPYVMSGLQRRKNPYDARRQMALSMVQGGMDFSPVQHPLQGASRLAQALVGTLMMRNADSEEAAADKARQEAFGKAIDTMRTDPQAGLAMLGKVDPETGVKMAAGLATQRIKREEDARALNGLGPQIASGYGVPMPSGQGGPANAIAGIESGGRYDAVGPETGKGRALGKFQVMSFNVGPWTKEILGQEMTPEQFLASPEAQEKVFQGKFGQYIRQYGSPAAAARAWFAGEGGMNNPNARDVNGMTVANYEQKFIQAGGAAGASANPNALPVPQPPQAAPQAAPQGLQPPPIPNVPRPQATPELIQRAAQMAQSGMWGTNPDQARAGARQWIEQQIDDQWKRDSKRAEMEYAQAQSDYKDQRTRAEKAPKETFESAMQLRKEYSSEPVVKQYRTVIPMLETAQDAVTRPTRAADINLVYAFAKLMDPDSVVRESETGMVMATGTVGDKIGAYLGQLNGGPMLKPETRANLIRELQSRLGPMKESYDQITNAYGKIADSGGIPREHVMLPIREAKPATPATSESGAQTIKTPRGTVTIQRVP